MLKGFLINEGYKLSSVDLSQMATLQNGPEFLSSSLQQLNNPPVRPQFSTPERLNYEQSLYVSNNIGNPMNFLPPNPIPITEARPVTVPARRKGLRRAIPSIQPVDEESNSTTDSVDEELNSTSVDEELNSTSVDEELNSTSVDEELNSTTHSIDVGDSNLIQPDDGDSNLTIPHQKEVSLTQHSVVPSRKRKSRKNDLNKHYQAMLRTFKYNNK
ncbi:hypothetical protein ACTA71_005971 [Dictyostelium dimigraforme]